MFYQTETHFRKTEKNILQILHKKHVGRHIMERKDI